MKPLRYLVAAFLCALTLTGCPVNPATGERQLILISESQEIRLGQQGAQSVEASIGLLDDPALQEYVAEIGHRLATSSERPDLPWSFKVVEDPVVNAFALPGGFIYVTRGILGHFNSEAELAGVLGHEIGHVTARHSAEQISRAQLAQVGVVAGSVFVPEVSQYGQVVGFGLNVLFLKFSRDDERQADDLGVRYMTRENYDPIEMADVMTTLERVSEAAGARSLPGWLATHPDPGERRQRIEAAVAREGGSTGGVVERDRYLRQIDGLVFGENPRLGFFREELFLHPDLEFQIEFPAGWTNQNMAQAVLSVSPQQDAVIQLTGSGAESPDDAYQSFFAEEGIRAGRVFRDEVNGIAGIVAEFTASLQQGTARGLAVFLSHRSVVFQLLGYSGSTNYGSYEPVFRRSLYSFKTLTDRRALAVQPRRIRLVTTDRAMSLDEFDRRYPSTVPLSTIALINGLEEGAMVAAGVTLKRVVGGE